MVFRTKCSFYLVLFAMASVKPDSSETDDDALQQALFLVNLLKSDYAKLILRENVEGSTENPSTCPLTTQDSSSPDSENATTPTAPTTTTSATSSTIASTAQESLSPTFYSMTSPPPVSPAQQPRLDFPPVAGSADELDYPEDYPHYDRPHRKFGNIKSRQFRKLRRMIPMDYYNYYDAPVNRRAFRPARRRVLPMRNYRRMGAYEMDIGSTSPTDAPTTVPTTTPEPSTTESPSISPAPTTVSTTLSSVPITVEIGTPNKVGSKASTPLRNKRLNTITSGKIQKPASKPKSIYISTTTENAVFPQVARELLNELNGGDLTMEPRSTKVKPKTQEPMKLKNKVNAISGSTKPLIARQQSEIMKKFSDMRKGTIRIHLDRSTPLTFPLPENNAFCFFSPKSPLCRTMI